MYNLEFISYDGKWPNLCSGNLILKLDNKEIIFPKHCLSSGGEVNKNDDGYHASSGKWKITKYPENFPSKLLLSLNAGCTWPCFFM